MQPANLVPPPQHGPAAGTFAHPSYTLLGRKFHVYSPDGSLFVKHPVLKLRQAFTMDPDESETQPLLTVKARQIVAHDVFDARTGEKVGTIRSRGLKSILRDTWDILDPQDQPVGLVQEDGAALLRRFFPLLTGKWHIELHGQTVAHIRQVFPVLHQGVHARSVDNQNRIDPRFAVACAVLTAESATVASNDSWSRAV